MSTKIATPLRNKLVKLHKSCMTLIELLIVMSVLALATGVIGVNIHRMMREQHFKTETELVLDYLRLAQNLMLIMDADVHVNFKAAASNDAIEMWIEVDNQIKDLSFLNLVINKPKLLSYTRFIDFNDQLKSAENKGHADLKFLSKGSVMSQGVMRLATNKNSGDMGALEAFICLAGYPKPLFITKKENDDPACNQEKQDDFDFRLTTFTVQEINAKQQENQSNNTNQAKQPESNSKPPESNVQQGTINTGKVE